MSQTVELKNRRQKYYLIYSGIFLFCAFLMVLYLYLHGKTNINSTSDGMNQHYRALLYYSRYLKQIFKTLLTEHRLVLPLWDFSIGEGADIISTLHSDAIGDPLTFLSVLVPEKWMPAYYVFNTLVRVYLAGIFFSMFCFYTGRDNETGVLAGTLTYVFGFWALHALTIHIYFITPLMYLPLLLLGLEKILKEGNGILFILAVFLSSISWLYFFYMEALATALYGILRVVSIYKKDLKRIIIQLFTIIGHAVIGILMASVVLAPMILSYMNDSRMSVGNGVNLLYPLFFYERLFTVFVSNDSAYDLYLGFVSPVLLSLFLLLKNYRKQWFLLLINVLCAVFILFPIFGKIWNGFSYVSQRWSFVVAMPIAYDMTVAWGHFKENRKYLLCCLPLIFCAAFFTPWGRNERVIVPFVLCVVFCMVAVFDDKDRFLNQRIRKVLLIGILILNIMYIYEFNLSPRGGNVINDLMSMEDAEIFTRTSEAYAMKKYAEDEDGFFRYSMDYPTNNASILYDVHSTNFYWSITNPYDQRFRNDIGLRDRLSWQLIGYDDRAELETLANVRYYVYGGGYAGTVPYGFEYRETIDGYSIYENMYDLPFGYTYTKTVSSEDYEKLNMLEKQEIMLQGIVLDDPDTSTPLISTDKVVGYTVECDKHADHFENGFEIHEKDNLVHLHLNEPIHDEIYVLIEGLRYVDSQGIIEDDHIVSTIQSQAGDVRTYIFLMTPQHRYYYGKSDYVCYFGNGGEGLNDITVSFSLPGTYHYDDIKVISRSMDGYERLVDELKKDHLENVVFSANRVSGDIAVSENKYLLLSVPYSKGWKALVDGKEADLLPANGHYMALYLNTGHHTIELKYRTPGLDLGYCLSALGFVLFGTTVILKNKMKNKK